MCQIYKNEPKEALMKLQAIEQYVIRRTCLTTCPSLVLDGRGQPMIFASKESADSEKATLERTSGNPAITYKIEVWHEPDPPAHEV
jgi:hypothetical protein